jgi:hypothetical protein
VPALDVKPASGSSIATYTCGSPPTIIVGSLEGSVIGLIRPANAPFEEFKVLYKTVGKGLQQFKSFEGGTTDVLKSKLVEGLELPKEEEAALHMNYVQTNEEPVEINTHA